MLKKEINFHSSLYEYMFNSDLEKNLNHVLMMTYGMIKDRFGKDKDKSRTRSCSNASGECVGYISR